MYTHIPLSGPQSYGHLSLLGMPSGCGYYGNSDIMHKNGGNHVTQKFVVRVDLVLTSKFKRVVLRV